MLKRLWNSKEFEVITDVTYNCMTGLGKLTKDVLEAMADIMNQPTEERKEEQPTYDYWMTLSYEEQKEYFNRNEYLKIYTNDFYENDRELTAKHMQHIANKLNREFTDKYDRY